MTTQFASFFRSLSLAVAAIALSFVATSAGAQTWAEVVKAAEAEGAVTVIIPPIAPHRATIEQFQAAYPKIKLELTAMVPAQYEPRVAAERKTGKYLWDVVISGVSTTVYTRQIPDGWYSSVLALLNRDLQRDDLWIGGFASGFLDKEGKYVFAFAADRIDTIFVDRSQIGEADLKSAQDLLDPKFKGKIAWLDPRQRGVGSFAATQLLLILGEKKYKELLADQGIVVTNTPRQIAEWAARGRYPIIIGTIANELAPFQAMGVGKQLERLSLPNQYIGVSPAWGCVMYFANAPHPNAARVFINWLLTTEAQADWAKRSLSNSRRTDVPPGMKETTVSADEWHTGLNLNVEKNSDIRLRAMAIATEALR